MSALREQLVSQLQLHRGEVLNICIVQKERQKCVKIQARLVNVF